MIVMQPGYDLPAKHKMKTRIDIPGSAMFCNF